MVLLQKTHERLKYVRKQLGLIQETFAKSIGLKQANIRDLELGKVKFTTLHALAIENVHKVNHQWLLSGEGNIFLNNNDQKVSLLNTLDNEAEQLQKDDIQSLFKRQHEELGNRLKKLKTYWNLTQKDMAKRLQIAVSTYQYYERGERDVPAGVLILVTTFGVSSKWLLTGEGEMFVQSSQQEAKSYEQKIDKEEEAEKLLEEAKKVLKSDDKDLVEGLKSHIKTAIRMMKMEKELHAKEKKKDE